MNPNPEELLYGVPVHEYNGLPSFFRIAEIPEPWSAQFLKAIVGGQCPAFAGEEDLAYVWNWTHWVNGNGPGRIGPLGLDAKCSLQS